jgi:hypothetical protein
MQKVKVPEWALEQATVLGHSHCSCGHYTAWDGTHDEFCIITQIADALNAAHQDGWNLAR